MPRTLVVTFKADDDDADWETRYEDAHASTGRAGELRVFRLVGKGCPACSFAYEDVVILAAGAWVSVRYEEEKA